MIKVTISVIRDFMARILFYKNGDVILWRYLWLYKKNVWFLKQKPQYEKNLNLFLNLRLYDKNPVFGRKCDDADGWESTAKARLKLRVRNHIHRCFTGSPPRRSRLRTHRSNESLLSCGGRSTPTRMATPSFKVTSSWTASTGTEAKGATTSRTGPYTYSTSPSTTREPTAASSTASSPTTTTSTPSSSTRWSTSTWWRKVSGWKKKQF